MSDFTAPEPGWYAPDPSAPGGWRKLGNAELTFGPVPDDAVRYRTEQREGKPACEAFTSDRNTALPNGQVVPAGTWTTVLFDTEPMARR